MASGSQAITISSQSVSNIISIPLFFAYSTTDKHMSSLNTAYVLLDCEED